MQTFFPPFAGLATSWPRLQTNTLWSAVCALILVAGCQKVPAVPSVADLRRAEQAKPGDMQLAQKYERACQTCHANHTSTAPLTGFAPAWQARLRQGTLTLVSHVRDGYKGMPPRGFCNDCNDQDFEALTAFMSTNLDKD